MFKYFQKKRELAAEIKASNEKREQEREARRLQEKKRELAAEIKASNEKREQEREARRLQEKNRTVLTVPIASVKNILALCDVYRDDEYNKNVNKYLLWKKIESALPETIEGNWFIEVKGSNVIKIKQIFSEVQCGSGFYYDNDYRDGYWDATCKKLS